MIGATIATIETDPEPARPPRGPDACIDLDRFCEGCGYNLRTLPVYLDDRTGIPVVRCPECGRFQPANTASTALRPWLNRATALALVLWMLSIASGFILLAVAEGALSYGTLDELTTWDSFKTQRIGNTTTVIYNNRSGPLKVNRDFEDFELFVSVVLGGSLAVALVYGALAAVVFPHWRRLAYLGFVLITPLLVGGLVTIGWHYEAPHLFGWGVSYLAAHAAVQSVGGVLGFLFGRPLARLAIRIFLPPGVRPRLAYLWLVDGKTLPSPHP